MFDDHLPPAFHRPPALSVHALCALSNAITTSRDAWCSATVPAPFSSSNPTTSAGAQHSSTLCLKPEILQREGPCSAQGLRTLDPRPQRQIRARNNGTGKLLFPYLLRFRDG